MSHVISNENLPPSPETGKAKDANQQFFLHGPTEQSQEESFRDLEWETDMMLQQADTNDNGYIEFLEFVSYYSTGQGKAMLQQDL